MAHICLIPRSCKHDEQIGGAQRQYRSDTAMGAKGLPPAPEVQAGTGARYLGKASGVPIGVDLGGSLHEYAIGE